MEKKKISKRVVVVIALIFTLIIIAGGVVWLFISGRLAYIGSNTVVCDTDIVDKYNDAMYYKVRSGSESPSIDNAGVKSLVATIKSKKDYKTDPTCQSIIFWSAVRDDNFNEAKTAYYILVGLHKKRIFVDSNLRSDQPLFTYINTLNGLTRPDASGQNNDSIGS